MNTPPVDALCIETGCDYPATTTRPNTDPWLTHTGVIIDCDEWVCAHHSDGP